MRKCNVPISIRLTQEESDMLTTNAKLCGLSKTSYLRLLIRGKVPKQAPPADFYAVMRELHKIGNNLNQICLKAHVLNVLDVQRYDNDLHKLNETIRLLTETVILPEAD